MDNESCTHPNAEDVGVSAEGMGRIEVEWCPDCGALKRTMTDWKYTDYPWRTPGVPVYETDSSGKWWCTVISPEGYGMEMVFDNERDFREFLDALRSCAEDPKGLGGNFREAAKVLRQTKGTK